MSAPLNILEQALAAAQSGHISGVLRYLNKGLDVNSIKAGESLLYKACVSGNLELIELLILRGASPNKLGEDGGGILHNAYICSKNEVVKLLLGQGKADLDLCSRANITPFGNALFRASYYKALLPAVKNLLEANANPNSLAENALTPLQAVVGISGENSIEITRMLLAKKADATLVGSGKRVHTPLVHRALWREDKAICLDLLLNNRANIDATDSEHLTALMVAAFDDNLENINILLERKASIDKPDKVEGFTAVHFAATKGLSTVVDRLIEARADLSIPNEKGKRPEESATEKGYLPLAEHIRKARLLQANQSEGNKPSAASAAASLKFIVYNI